MAANMKKACLSWLAPGALCIGLLSTASCNNVAHTDSSPDPPIRTTVAVAKVTRQTLSHTLEIAAEFRPFQEIEVYSKVAGYVKTIRVDYGDKVVQGQVLATLEVPELLDELEHSTASTKQAEEEVSAAEEELKRAESVYNVAHLEYTRLEGVMDTRPGLIAQQDLDRSMGGDREAQAKVAVDKAAAAAARQRLQAAMANERKVRTLLSYTQIIAPFRGVITKRYADTGAMIQQGTSSHTQAMPLVRLAETAVLRLVIPVPESDVPRIKLGEPIDVTVPSLNRTFQGKVARFSEQLDLETRTMHTEVDVRNPDLVLVPGMYAYARLSLAARPNVLSVPVQAVSRAEGKTSVLCVNNNALEEREVRLGLETPNRVEVISGLLENELVVVGDKNRLKAGEAVNPKTISEDTLREKS